MINQQKLDIIQLNSQSLKPMRVDLREFEQTLVLPRHDDISKSCGAGGDSPTVISELVERCRWHAAGKLGCALVGVDPAKTVEIVQWWR